jgi:translation elongation factor EF-Tu-like GTPase
MLDHENNITAQGTTATLALEGYATVKDYFIDGAPEERARGIGN